MNQVDANADAIHRAAALRDFVVDVSVAHTRSRFRARFCIEFQCPGRTKWAVGVDLREVQAFQRHVWHAAKAPTKHLPSRNHASDCRTCAMTRQELRRWPRFSALSVVAGMRHLDDKATRLECFLQRLFAFLADNATQLAQCELLRELLRMTETQFRLQSEDSIERRHAQLVTRWLRGLRCRRAPDAVVSAECAVCLDLLVCGTAGTECDHEVAVELPCGHAFHEQCVGTWLQKRRTCPMCRRALDVPAV